MIKVSTLVVICAVAYIGFLIGNACSYQRVESIRLPYYSEVHAEISNTLKEDKLYEIDLSMWIIVAHDHRNFYFTDRSIPNHFSEQMTYIWNERGCYAFLPEEFTFDEIYQLVMYKPR
jgi:hypothetical protein